MNIKELEGVKVFVVDDNPNNLNLIKDHLSQNGLKATPLKSGEAALDLIKRIRPDIFLLDVQMYGGIDGFETCRRLKKIDEVRDIPVIFVSAVSDSVDKVTGFAAGGVDYITKPIEVEELLSRIYVHIKIYRLQIELLEAKKSLEEKVQIRTGELKELKNYLSNVIDVLPSMVIGVDDNYLVLQWNNCAEKQTGISSTNARGKDLFELLEYLKDEKSKIIEFIANGKEGEILRKRINIDEQVRYEDIFIYPLTYDDFKGAVIRIDDITNKIYMEEFMIQSEKMVSIAGLAAGMAHEINNPLAGIIQSASVIESRLGEKLDNGASKEVARELEVSLEIIKEFLERRNIFTIIHSIKKSGRRLSDIVNNMLGFVYKTESSYSSHSLSEIMDECIELSSMDYNMKKKYDFKLIKITREYEKDIPDVYCDKSKIEQVFLNILQNGAHAMMEKGERESEFVIRIKNDGDLVRVEIEDNGSGIDDGVRKKVFDPFFTTKEPGIGTGLGLSISYYIIVEDHKGHIKIEPGRERGSNFIIQLPVKRD